MKGGFQGKLALISKWLGEDCGRVLDVGCSSGYFSNHLLTKSKEVYAIDINKDVIEFAKDHYKDVKFSWVSIEKAPYPKEYFDTIVALDIIEHCKNDKKAIGEIKRILKRGGRLILSVPYRGPLDKFDIENVSFNFPNLTKLFVMKAFPLRFMIAMASFCMIFLPIKDELRLISPKSPSICAMRPLPLKIKIFTNMAVLTPPAGFGLSIILLFIIVFREVQPLPSNW